MTTHFKGPLEVSLGNFGGLAVGAGLEITQGMTDAITTFDDFNGFMPVDSFSAALILEQMGWILTDVGAPANDAITINAHAAGNYYDSCLSITAGTVADTGGNMQLDTVNSTLTIANLAENPITFPHIWMPENSTVTLLDNTHWGFACRIGLSSSATTWDGKVFVGWAEAGDTGIMTAATGAITQAETGPLLGFHIGEDGSIDGISQRTVNTAYAEGTNFTELVPATWNTGLTAGNFYWFDLCLHMHITDMSDNAANGTTQFAWRQIGPPAAAGSGQINSRSNTPWRKHPTVLVNQTINNNVSLVPTIEVANGPAALSIVKFDWWTFGTTRFSHT